jgi:hypothetical protein
MYESHVEMELGVAKQQRYLPVPAIGEEDSEEAKSVNEDHMRIL